MRTKPLNFESVIARRQLRHNRTINPRAQSLQSWVAQEAQAAAQLKADRQPLAIPAARRSPRGLILPVDFPEPISTPVAIRILSPAATGSVAPSLLAGLVTETPARAGQKNLFGSQPEEPFGGGPFHRRQRQLKPEHNDRTVEKV